MKFAAVPNKNPALVNLVSSGDFWGLTEKEKKYYHECKLVHGIGSRIGSSHWYTVVYTLCMQFVIPPDLLAMYVVCMPSVWHCNCALPS